MTSSLPRKATGLSRRLTPAVAALFASLALANANAASTVEIGAWTPIFRGIDTTVALVDGNNTAYVVRIDLDAPGVGFTTTGLGAGFTPNTGNGFETLKQQGTSFVQQSGVSVALTGNFFLNNDNTPAGTGLSGFAMSNGVVVSPAQGSNPSLLISQNNLASIVPGSTVNPTGAWNAVSGNAYLVANGVNLGGDASDAQRSAIGLSQDGRTMVLVATVGNGTTANPGTSFAQTADLLLALGSYTGINTSGGASSTLDIADGLGGVIKLNRPASGPGNTTVNERYVGNFIGVYAAPLSPVPEAGTAWLMGAGLVSMATLVARRRRQNA